ncbi:extensin-like [Gouania willdenowi]|uniref:extensin-like n=1 Tax=Gouania willdenowi TaxID=441366 RepID=UPI0010561C8B|nr:extensin-like [Gouania willdenowi]
MDFHKFNKSTQTPPTWSPPPHTNSHATSTAPHGGCCRSPMPRHKTSPQHQYSTTNDRPQASSPTLPEAVWGWRQCVAPHCLKQCGATPNSGQPTSRWVRPRKLRPRIHPRNTRSTQAGAGWSLTQPTVTSVVKANPQRTQPEHPDEPAEQLIAPPGIQSPAAPGHRSCPQAAAAPTLDPPALNPIPSPPDQHRPTWPNNTTPSAKRLKKERAPQAAQEEPPHQPKTNKQAHTAHINGNIASTTPSRRPPTITHAPKEDVSPVPTQPRR